MYGGQIAFQAMTLLIAAYAEERSSGVRGKG